MPDLSPCSLRFVFNDMTRLCLIGLLPSRLEFDNGHPES